MKNTAFRQYCYDLALEQTLLALCHILYHYRTSFPKSSGIWRASFNIIHLKKTYISWPESIGFFIISVILCKRIMPIYLRKGNLCFILYSLFNIFFIFMKKVYLANNCVETKQVRNPRP